MPQFSLKNGIRRTVGSAPQQDHPCENTVAVAVRGAVVPWVLRFWCLLGNHRSYAGAVRIFASQDQRVVAVCSMPGASMWEVEGRAYDGTQDELVVHFEGLEACAGPYGVHAIPGNSVDGGRSYRVITGAAGVVVVTGEVFGWAARATAINATVAVAALPALGFGPIGVPAAGEVNGNAMGLLAPVSTWTFVGTSGYVIEYVPPGINFDG
jgi:hypothetical protein